ncbi:MAG: signal recognition particle-docking protein FtsY [SAR202 cluster bacterium]|nr:signal recognition particle-docking protein FtsY [SAR202 cluster bacterium]
MLRIFKRNKEESKAKTQQAVQKSRGSLFGRIMGILKSSPQLDESLWEQLEEILISGDVGVETSLSIVQRVKERAKKESLGDAQQVFGVLKEELISALGDGATKADTETKSQAGPYVVLVVGVNGVGKTTSIAKLAKLYAGGGQRVLLAAGDTFRAAAIEQLQILAQRVGVDVVAHQHGADPGAVAFDAYQAAKARDIDVLIVDTAGRLHTKTNLMEEMKKVRSVIKRLDASAPHHTLLVLDATTGYNGLAQAKAFKDTIECSGIFLAKLDGTAKGGIALAIRRELGLPIYYIGTGEKIEDIAPFEPEEFVEALLAPLN